MGVMGVERKNHKKFFSKMAELIFLFRIYVARAIGTFPENKECTCRINIVFSVHSMKGVFNLNIVYRVYIRDVERTNDPDVVHLGQT